MIGCASQGQGSSTRSTTRTWSRTRPSWVLERCGYSCRPELRWSETNTNPDKLFSGCPDYNGKTWCEFFLWADDVEEEEEHERRVDATTIDNEQVKVNLAWRIEKLEAKVRTQKCMIRLLGIVVFFTVVVILVMTLKF
ncbi:hypothetical protein Ahy_A08g040453 [Arachis hypogaea]|uniref:Zinc finger GRF-type domain-containing protein n=1 Tax=Arachis hypogaea TaxID=3818 RepID=A0A445BZZ2_ARAHY|nr:hypothetical protein Ahy_A08g040453 [Arachis hypogaea]